MEVVVMSLLATSTVVLSLHGVRCLAGPRVELPVAASAAHKLVAMGRLRRLLRRLGRREWLLRLAGVRFADGTTAEQVGVAAVAAFLLVAGCVVGPAPGPLLAPVTGLALLRAPAFMRARTVGRRRAQIDAELPQFLDALAAASTAGLSAQLAVRRAADVARGPLNDELIAVLRAADLGSRWRDELHGLAERIDLPDLRRAVSVITRTETLGASLSTATIQLAERVRSSRRQRVTERARTAPVKMLFPLVFLVLPAFLLLTVVPVLLTTMQSIR